MGVVDTLSAGYGAINRRAWVLLIPILIDLFLWQGPRVSFSPLIDPMLAWTSEMVSQADTAGAAGATETERSAAVQMESLRQDLMVLARESNAFALVTRGPLGVPSAVALVGGAGTFRFVSGWGEALTLVFTAFVASLAAGGLLRSVIADHVRDGTRRFSLAAAVQPLLANVARVVGFALLVLGVGLLLGTPVALMLGVTALFAPPVAAFAALLVSLAVAIAELYLFFVVEAIFVSEVGPLAAIRRSVGITRTYFWHTVALVGLTLLIMAGMDQVWLLLSTHLTTPFGLGLAILGNAYIACGLIAARMIFYKERSELLARQPS